MATGLTPREPIFRVGATRRLRVTARLVVELFILAVLITGACAWTAIALVDNTFDVQLQTELELSVEGAERVAHDEMEALNESLRGLGGYFDLDSDYVESFFAGPEESIDTTPLLRETTARLMRQYQLDYLDILDEHGKVLSSGEQWERVGVDDQRFTTLAAGAFQLSPIMRDDEQRLVITGRLDLEFGLRRLILIGGRLIDEQFVNRLAGREAAVLFVGSNEDEPPRVLPSGQLLDVDADELAAVDDDETLGSPIPFEQAGRTFIFGRALLVSDSPEVAWVVVGVDTYRFERLLDELREAFLLLGLGVGLVAAGAGVWIARRTGRPVRDLVSALESVGRGDADYSFNFKVQDEAQELARSFSRLHHALEDQRRRSMAAERVAAWREVARHVAHEVKNPLAPIRLTVENLIRARSQAPERFDGMFRDGMQTILEEVDQLSRMVGEFAEFARLPLPVRRDVDLDALIDRVIDLYASEPGVEIRKKFSAEVTKVQLDSDQLSRALKNIIGNAIEAARERPAAAEGNPLVEIRVSLEEGMARIEVTDNGPGLSQEAETRLFEPYFTTKAHGTGLGMALTYRIVIEHDGLIFAENRSSGGARVVIRLPLVAPEPQLAGEREEAVG